MLERILCAILGHRYVVERVMAPHWRKVGCARCRGQWSMHDPTRTFVPWDGEQEELARMNHPAAFGLSAADSRTCTCHPDDNPPKPCPRKFALRECRAAAGLTDMFPDGGTAGAKVASHPQTACQAEQRGSAEWVCDCSTMRPDCKPTLGLKAAGEALPFDPGYLHAYLTAAMKDLGPDGLIDPQVAYFLEWLDDGVRGDGAYLDQAAGVPTEKAMPLKLWLWKNFVDGKPEYWAFDNAYPINLEDGDPQTLGEPCGYAILKPSRKGRSDVSDEQVLRAIVGAKVGTHG